MSGYRPVATPSCCPLGAANLEWFPASPPAGAWHASSFRWDARRDAPPLEPLAACPFCGRPLAPPPAAVAATR